MRERMLAGDLYIADDPQLVRDRQQAAQLVELFNRSPASGPADRRRLLTELLGSFGQESEIRPPLYCDYGYQTRIGDRTFVNFGLVLLDVAPIAIGDAVQIGPYVQLHRHASSRGRPTPRQVGVSTAHNHWPQRLARWRRGRRTRREHWR